MDIGYEDDEIFLLTSRSFSTYYKVIPPLACWWWLIAPDLREGCAVPHNGYSDEGYYLDSDEQCAVRPAIKYSNIKDKITKAPDSDEYFYFNHHTFKIIDCSSETAIAVTPVAFDHFDVNGRTYEESSIRAKLLHWFKTGVWSYELAEKSHTILSVCKTSRDNELFKSAVDLILKYNEASIPLLMMELGISPKCAAELIEDLEKCGIIGGFEGPKPRRLLISKPQEYSRPIKIGFKDDTIFLLSVHEYMRYCNYISTHDGHWWLRDSGGKSDNAAIVDDITLQCDYSTIQDSFGIRPAIKYTKLKKSITTSLHCEGRIIFNDHPFRIIDIENEIAIAEVPIANDMYDSKYNHYETSSLRKHLLKWFYTGIWEYD